MFGQFEKNEYKDSFYFGEEVRTAILEKWGGLVVPASDISVPVGWQEMVNNMLGEITLIRGDKEIYWLGTSWGSLESRVLIRRKGRDSIKPLEITDKYRIESHSTCFGCGCSARRKIVQGQVHVLCSGCEKKFLEAINPEHTGTWLDNF